MPWKNPTLEIGEEERTTERYMGLNQASAIEERASSSWRYSYY